MQEGREQPNASQAALIGAEVASGDDEFAEKFNIAIQVRFCRCAVNICKSCVCMTTNRSIIFFLFA